MAFETEFNVGPFELEGDIASIKAEDENEICRKNEDWQLTLTWSVWGDALDENSAVGLRDGDWIAHAHLESIGKAAGEFDLGPVRVKKDSFALPATPDPVRPHERVYTAVFDVLADSLDVGLYRIAATITYELDPIDPAAPVTARMAGFIEGSMVQIYDAPAPAP